MSPTWILIAVQLIAVVGSKASAQTYDCVADSSDEAVGLREDVVSARNMVVIKIANSRYVIKDPAERQGEFGSVLITDGRFTVLARITG